MISLQQKLAKPFNEVEKKICFKFFSTGPVGIYHIYNITFEHTSTSPLGSVSVPLEMRVGMHAPMWSRWVSRQRGGMSVVTVAGPSHVGVAWVGCWQVTRMIDTHMGVAILVESTAEALRAGKKMCCRMLWK